VEKTERVPCDGVADPACVERFWAKVAPANERGCRLWTGAVNAARTHEQGVFAGGPRVPERGNRRRMVLSHRFAWELARGPAPGGLDVRHTCDVGTCCAIEHLLLGTRRQNAQDTLERYVAPSGAEGNGNAKLTHEEAAEVHRLAHEGVLAQGDIGRRFGIGQSQVSAIKRGVKRSYSVERVAA
jgi:hypothetical protein